MCQFGSIHHMVNIYSGKRDFGLQHASLFKLEITKTFHAKQPWAYHMATVIADVDQWHFQGLLYVLRLNRQTPTAPMRCRGVSSRAPPMDAQAIRVFKKKLSVLPSLNHVQMHLHHNQ